MTCESVMLRVVLSPAEERDLQRLAQEPSAALDRLHQRIVDLYHAHRDDPDGPVTQQRIAEIVGYTQQRVQQIISERRT